MSGMHWLLMAYTALTDLSQQAYCQSDLHCVSVDSALQALTKQQGFSDPQK